jgi:glycosyltransferase involved in cell wall biosynthesis
MRVLHLNTHPSGGSYEYAALLSSALAQEGIESHVLCKNSRPAEGTRLFLDRVIRRSYVSLSKQPWHGTLRLLCPPAPEKLKEVDVVHLHTVADWFNVPRWLETLPARIGLAISLHDMWHVTGGCFLYDGCNSFNETCTPCPILKAPLNRILARDEQRRKLQTYRSRRAEFVANSQWLADLVNQSPIPMSCGGVRVITPGIDNDVFKPQDKAYCRAQLGVPAETFVIAAGAASLTDTNKNVRWLLEQLAGLSDLQNLTVVLAGEGALKVPANLNVRLLGGISDRRKRAMFYAAADVFVSASLMETYGLTLVEALSCGTPVVAFRTGGIPEAVPDGEAGILCDLLDEASFQSAIGKLRSSRQLRNELGMAGAKLAASRNSRARFAAAFVRVYEESLRRRARASAIEPVVMA